jgi:thymine-DNA glycosylase
MFGCVLVWELSMVMKQEQLTDALPVKKKRDRFNGLTEDEVLAKLLPDHLDFNLDIVIVSIHFVHRFE